MAGPSRLVVDAGTDGVAAHVTDDAGGMVVRAEEPTPFLASSQGWAEHSPEQLWQATLRAVGSVLADDVVPRELTVLGAGDSVVLWDRETLGSPRAAILGLDDRAAAVCERLRTAGHEGRVAELTGRPLDPRRPGPVLAWLAEHEPHTWALVTAGRYAVGPVASYLVARMSRGLDHVVDHATAGRTLLLARGGDEWSGELCSIFGVPVDVLPDLVAGPGTLAVTDPTTFLGLELPVTELASR